MEEGGFVSKVQRQASFASRLKRNQRLVLGQRGLESRRVICSVALCFIFGASSAFG